MKIKKLIPLLLALAATLLLVTGCRSNTPTRKMIVEFNSPGQGKEWMCANENDEVVQVRLEGADYVIEGKKPGTSTVNYWDVIKRSMDRFTATTQIFTTVAVDENRLVYIVNNGLIDLTSPENGFTLTFEAPESGYSWVAEWDDTALNVEAKGLTFTVTPVQAADTSMAFYCCKNGDAKTATQIIYLPVTYNDGAAAIPGKLVCQVVE